MAIKDELLTLAAEVGQLETDFAAVVGENVELKADNGRLTIELAECRDGGVVVPPPDPDPNPPPPPPDTLDEHPIPFDAIELNPSTFTQTRVDQLGVDAHIVLADATYKGAVVTLKPGQGLYGYGPQVSVFDGENNQGEALKPASGVVIAHLGFTRFKGSGADGMAPIAQNSASGVTIYHVDSWRNHKSGLRTLSSWIVKRFKAWENGQYGMSGNHPALLETYELWRNGRGDIPGVPPHDDSNKGGTKFTKSNGGIDRYGNVHHNDGMGHWADIGNNGLLVEYLHSWENVRHGIISEANLGPMRYRFCNSHDNGPSVPASPKNIRWAQIFTSLTPNTTIEDCTVKGRVGITGYQWNHRQIYELNRYGDKIALKNLLVQRNVIDAEIAAGIVYFNSSIPSPLNANNRWVNNDYLGDPKFVWANGDGPLINRAAWTALGHS